MRLTRITLEQGDVVDSASLARTLSLAVPEYDVRWSGGGGRFAEVDQARRALICYRLDHPDRKLDKVQIVELPESPFGVVGSVDSVRLGQSGRGVAAYHAERGIWLCGARIDPAEPKPVLAALRSLFEEQQKLALP